MKSAATSIGVAISFVQVAQGYAYCLREMCAVRLECNHPPELTEEESSVLQSERGVSTPERIRRTLKMAYSYKFST